MAGEKTSQDALLKRLKRFVLKHSVRGSIWRRERVSRFNSGSASVIDRDVPLTRREVGARGEKLAVDFLKDIGYEIMERNFRCRQGEIDIVARQGECLVFVEVRTRRGRGFGTPEESITSSKREKLIALANIYVQTLNTQPLSWRIDVIVVELTPGNRVSRLEHIENAVN